MHPKIKELKTKVFPYVKRGESDCNWIEIVKKLKNEFSASRIQSYYVLKGFGLEEDEIENIISDSNLWEYKRDVTDDFYETLLYETDD